jgi:hypothetical protein
VWRWADVKMSRCEDEQMRYRPPLLEEPCAQTLSGTTYSWNHWIIWYIVSKIFKDSEYHIVQRSESQVNQHTSNTRNAQNSHGSDGSRPDAPYLPLPPLSAGLLYAWRPLVTKNWHCQWIKEKEHQLQGYEKDCSKHECMCESTRSMSTYCSCACCTIRRRSSMYP